MAFPTRRQIVALASYGVIPGTTSVVCRRMLQYIEAFPAAYPEKRKERARRLYEKQSEYLGREVEFHTLEGRGFIRDVHKKGVVRGVYAKGGAYNRWTFVAEVTWTDTLETSTVELKRLVVRI